jgi:SAM-dependent methyltransferase
MVENIHGDFSCSCCGHDKYTAIGAHLLSTRTDRRLFEGSAEVSRPLVSCTHCTHVTVHPLPSKKAIPQFYENLDYWHGQGIASDLAQGSWLENLTSIAGLWERYIKAKLHLQIIRDHAELDADTKIIDLGSGLSPFLFHSQRAGFTNLYALEPAKDICRYLDGQGITTYPTLLETFITRQDVPKFDVMVLSQTLEHLVSPNLVLSDLRNMLSDRGLIIITVPDREHLRPFRAGLHFHFFNERSMSHLLTKCGYGIIRIHADELNALDRLVVKTLQFIYRKRYANKSVTAKSVLENPWIHFIHKYCWRPVKSLLRLNSNIFISYQDLVALATVKGGPLS